MVPLVTVVGLLVPRITASDIYGHSRLEYQDCLNLRPSRALLDLLGYLSWTNYMRRTMITASSGDQRGSLGQCSMPGLSHC